MNESSNKPDCECWDMHAKLDLSNDTCSCICHCKPHYHKPTDVFTCNGGCENHEVVAEIIGDTPL